MKIKSRDRKGEENDKIKSWGSRISGKERGMVNGIREVAV